MKKNFLLISLFLAIGSLYGAESGASWEPVATSADSDSDAEPIYPTDAIQDKDIIRHLKSSTATDHFRIWYGVAMYQKMVHQLENIDHVKTMGYILAQELCQKDRCVDTDANVLRNLIEVLKIDINKPIREGEQTLLQIAIGANNSECVRILLHNKALINFSSTTADLIIAVQQCDAAIVQDIIVYATKYYAELFNINAKNRFGKNAFDYALARKDSAIIDILSRHGAQAAQREIVIQPVIVPTFVPAIKDMQPELPKRVVAIKPQSTFLAYVKKALPYVAGTALVAAACWGIVKFLRK